jgi:hypothetical protein
MIPEGNPHAKTAGKSGRSHISAQHQPGKFALSMLEARRSKNLTFPSLCLGQNAKTKQFQKASPYGLASQRALANGCRWMVDPRLVGCAAPGNVPGQGNTKERLSKLKATSPQRK